MKLRVLLASIFFGLSSLVIGMQVASVEAKTGSSPVTSSGPITKSKPIPTTTPITVPKSLR